MIGFSAEKFMMKNFKLKNKMTLILSGLLPSMMALAGTLTVDGWTVVDESTPNDAKGTFVAHGFTAPQALRGDRTGARHRAIIRRMAMRNGHS